jgi:hypothetical protein
MIEVILTPADIAWCCNLAAQRLASKSDEGRAEKGGNLTSYGAHHVGVLAELAGSRLLGGRVSEMISARGDKHEPDLIDRFGRKVEVKGATYDGAGPVKLKVAPEEIKPDRHYVLVHVRQPDQCFVYPAVTTDELVRYGRVEDFGKGPRRTLDADKIIALKKAKITQKDETKLPNSEIIPHQQIRGAL